MRTTVDLPDALLRELKAKAAIEGTTLKQLVLALVERGLHGDAGQTARRGKRSPLPALDLNQPLAIRSLSNARLFELIDD
jgi:hypothetical protein